MASVTKTGAVRILTVVAIIAVAILVAVQEVQVIRLSQDLQTARDVAALQTRQIQSCVNSFETIVLAAAAVHNQTAAIQAWFGFRGCLALAGV